MANNKSNNSGSPARNRAATSSGTSNKSQKRRERRQRNAASGGGPPAAVGTGYIAQGPALIGGSRGSVRFSNTEFIADVVAPGVSPGVNTGPVITLNLNPTNPNAFPWLSRIATGYELYRFRRLVVRYTPSCSSSTAGIIVAAFDYDATDQPPPSKQVMSGYDGSVRGNVWNKLACPAKPMSGWYYTGTAGSSVSNPAGTDLKMYDLGKFYLGVYNQTGSAPVGEITVDYDVEFSRPDSSVLTGLSERIVNSAPTLTDLATASVTTGNNILVPTATGTSQLTLTASTAGDYMLEIRLVYMASSNVNPVASFLQYDPGATTSVSPSVVDQMTSAWTAANVSVTFIGLYVMSLLAGTTLVLTLNGAVTSCSSEIFRVSSYRKALA